MLKRIRQRIHEWDAHRHQRVIEQIGMAFAEGLLRGLGVPAADMPAKLKAVQDGRIRSEAAALKMHVLLRNIYGYSCGLNLLHYYASTKNARAEDIFNEAYRQLCTGDDQFIHELRTFHSNML